MSTPTSTLGATATTSTSSATSTCFTAVPDANGHVPVDACNAYYMFHPSYGGNFAFTVLFGITTAVQFLQAIIHRKPYCWVVVMGASWETLGFTFRTLGAHEQQNLAYAIMGQLFFLLAPLWINVFVYMTVARMVLFGLPERKIWHISGRWLSVIFIVLDIVCFLVQAVGGSMLSNPDNASSMKLGRIVYMVGIGIQKGFILVFGGMTLDFYRRMHRLTGGYLGRMKWLVWNMLAVLLLIVIRICYRLAEFAPGADTDNPILRSEDYAFCLDALPMLLALILLNIMHPGLVLPRNFKTKQEKYEELGGMRPSSEELAPMPLAHDEISFRSALDERRYPLPSNA